MQNESFIFEVPELCTIIGMYCSGATKKIMHYALKSEPYLFLFFHRQTALKFRVLYRPFTFTFLAS